ncbi:MAG: transporter substrate-binding domain-containing protein [Deltaproteobacteria bacterium]|nr:transporter substrate-binding domain-containing protein [Deltaproteobacteria bacterium]
MNQGAGRHYDYQLKWLSFLMLAVFVLQTQPLCISIASVPVKEQVQQTESVTIPTPQKNPDIPNFSLTHDEAAWLDAHPDITIAINQAWPPMDYVDTEGEPQGIGVGFIKALNIRLNGRLKIVPLPWSGAIERIRKRNIDALMDITPRADREAFLNFTTPYLTVPHNIIARKDASYYEDLTQLRGKTVCVERRFFIESVLREKYPGIHVKRFDTTSDALDAVSKGEADAYVGNRAVAMYIIERELITNLKVHGKIQETASINAIGVRKDWPVLRDILQKGLDDIKRKEVSALLRKWVDLPGETAAATVQLSPEERKWLKAHPQITMAFDGDYAPYSFQNEKGEFKGIAVDVAQELARRLGIKLNVYPEGAWKRLYDAAQQGNVDVIATLVLRPEREKLFEFSQPYISIAQYIITRKEDGGISTREQLNGKTLALVKGYATTDQVLHEFPTVKPYEVNTLSEALEAVSTGKAEATVAGMGLAHHLIASRGFLNLKFAAMYAQGLSDERFGVRKDWPQLAAILDKALDSMPDNERLQIFQRWSIPEIAQIEAVTTPWKNFKMTDAEKAWLQDHPNIRIGIMNAWPPLNFVNDAGAPQGIGVDVVEALNRRLNGILTIEAGSFNINLDRAKKRELDALMDITPTKEREAYFNFTLPYLTIPHVIVGTRDGTHFKSEKDLKGKTVALERGYYNIQYFKAHYPEITIKEYDSTSQALGAVSRGEADAYAGNHAVVTYLIEKELMANLRVMARMEKPPVALTIGVRKDWPILRGLLDRALNDISREEERGIHRKWIEEMEEVETSLNLTSEERAWLRDHPFLNLGYDTDWPPVEYVDKQGRFVGMSADFMKTLSSLMGITIKPTKRESWQTTLEAVKAGSLDVLFSVARTPQREKILLFSDPYLHFPMVIVTSQNAPYIGALEDLEGKRIAVVKGYASHDILKDRHLGFDLYLVDNVTDGLKAVTRKDAYAFVGSLAAISHVMGREGISGLKVSGETPYDYELSVGVRKDQPILASIIQKALNAISEEERNAIFQRWVSVTYDRGFNYQLLWKILLGAVLIFSAVLYWNRRLTREIGLRRKAEEELTEAKEAAESANRVKSAFLASMSHELRTPLNSIIGFTGIVLNELAGPLNLEQKKQLKMVKGSSRHLLDLINDVLDISKIEAGEVEVSREKFSIRQVISQVLESLYPLAQQKGLSLSSQIAPQVDYLISDERRIQQILINLANNAIKFTEKGGVKINCRKHNSRMEIAVSDSGIGIREEDMEKLFKPFQQLDTGTSRRYDGTGLGLSICKRILDVLGGTIRVKSHLGKGTTFTFTLPLNPEEENDIPKDSDR